MSDFRNPREFVRRAPQGTPTLRQFVRRMTAAQALVAQAKPNLVAPAVTPLSTVAANEDRGESLSDSARSAEA